MRGIIYQGRTRVDRLGGNLLFGVITGLFLEWFNIMSGGLTTFIPNLTGGTFRLHHIWVGLFLILVGAYIKAPFFIGLGAVLMVGDYYEHLRPDGSVAPFW